MLKKILWLSIGCFFTLSVHAQHEEKVQIKLDQIQNLLIKVEDSALDNDQKDWAKEVLLKNLVTLESFQEESEIERLKPVEIEVNQINQAVVKAMIQAQRIKLIRKIKQIDALIVDYSARGMDTKKLQLLQASMLSRLTLEE